MTNTNEGMMASPTLGLEFYRNRDWIDCSAMKDFCRCPRLFFYRHGCGLTQEEEHHALTYGTAFHAAVPLLHRGDMTGAISAFAQAWGDGDLKGDKNRNSTKAKVLMEFFLRAHSESTSLYKIIPPPKGVDIKDKRGDDEVAFAVDIGLDVPFIGRIDAIAEHKDTKERYVVEYKTVGWMTSNFTSAFSPMNPQTMGYVVAGSALSRESIAGAIVEALDTKNNTSMPILTRFSEYQLKWWLEWARATWRAIATCERTGVWTQNLAGCNSYHCHGLAGFPCPYATLCTPEDWTSVRALYTYRPWSPFDTTEGTGA